MHVMYKQAVKLQCFEVPTLPYVHSECPVKKFIAFALEKALIKLKGWQKMTTHHYPISSHQEDNQ